jgi:Predicted Zn peptidase
MRDRKLRIRLDRLKQIRQAANEVLRKIDCTEPPVPVEQVAAVYGAELLFAPYDEKDELAGMLVSNGHQPIIAVNSAHHRNRQRFTIAHECGHLILGHKGQAHLDKSFRVMRRDLNSSLANNIEEVEANQFAAELLMPLRFLLRDMPSIDFESDERVLDLSRKYEVSSLAMSYRIANLFM